MMSTRTVDLDENNYGRLLQQALPHVLRTDEEYERMKKTDLCLYCAKKGHRISACPDKAEGKPRTKATPEQLKE